MSESTEKYLALKHEQGRTLVGEGKNGEAEEMFREVVRGKETILRPSHPKTIEGKYWLGHALSSQRKYGEAEEVFREALCEDEKILRHNHISTLVSKDRLGQVLYHQEKYSEAERIFQEVVCVHEKTLGHNHEYTLNIKRWLQRALEKQQKDSETERQSQQAADGQERTLSRGNEETLGTMSSFQKLHPNSSLLLPTNNTGEQALAGRLSSFFSEGQDSREPYTDSEINKISALLKHLNQRWSKFPRTYIILRVISHLDMLDRFIDIGFSDYWLPVTERNLPGCLLPSVKTSFVRAQSLVLTKSMDLEKGGTGQHCHFKQGEPLPLDPRGILGGGAFAQVDKVLSQISFREYARKQVLRSAAFTGPRKKHMELFIAEIQILKRLKHHHIVDFVGSYTDPRYISLLMSPVADMDLDVYLKKSTAANYPELRTFFGCLATALDFLHEQKVRHKDIKPRNILVHRGNVLFTDFGLSLDFTDADGSTTMSMVNGMTPRYCAPEVAQLEPRNTMSDIWSLGVVFMEMIVVLKGQTVQYMIEFLKRHGSGGEYIRTNPVALSKLIGELKDVGELADNEALSWAQQMLLTEPRLRPTATDLVASIRAFSKEGEGAGFCGICCAFSEEEFSD